MRMKPAFPSGLSMCALAFVALVAGLAVPRVAAADTVEIAMRAHVTTQQILPGTPTAVWRYEASLISGRPGSVESFPSSYLGPIIRVRTGDRLVVHFTNELPEETTLHWHGLDVPSVMDGHPERAIAPGETRRISFPIVNRAGMSWFHPHPHMRTGAQVALGLAGVVIVSDAAEDALGLPAGAQDVPLVLQDRRFDAANQIAYAMPMVGWLGDRILVNGRPGFTLDAETRAYRLRFLNGSNARAYKLAWSDGTPMTVLATDAGLLEAPVTRPYVMLAPSQRIEIWLDLSSRPVGASLTLRSLAFSGFGAGFPELQNGAPFDVMQVVASTRAKEWRTLPGTLVPIERYQYADAVNASSPRTFALSAAAGMWRINGLVYEPGVVGANEQTTTDTLEAWRFTNTSTMMLMGHPMHIHGPQFQVYSRSVQSGQASVYATVSGGLVDSGWNDTVLVMPGETVTVLFRTSRYPGLYLYHCHNLEHEDMGMMRNYSLVKPCPADVDADGVVAASDLSALLSAWGVNPGDLADIDGSGAIDAADLTALLGAWGACP
jgi:FtsP/CotA-like multicopper oxidase with cupredoxin domain